MGNFKKRKFSGFNFRLFSKKQLRLLNWWAEYSPVKDRFMCIADGSVRSGKEQPLDSILITPTGFKLMGDIKIGDYVLDRFGNPTKVVGVFPQGLKDVYKITFNDGSCCECGKQHLWSYTTKKCVANKNYTMFTSTLNEIMEDIERFSDRQTTYQKAGKYRFPICKCVNFESKPVSIDPYLLGLLLGDGCFSYNNYGIIFINDEDDLHEYIKNKLNDYDMIYLYNDRKDNHCAYWRLVNKVNSGSKTKLRLLLESYNLFSKESKDKFVPEDYKFNSKDIRLGVLAGLLNTGGSVSIDRQSISYSSMSKQLFEDVVFLARSLGLFVKSNRKVDSIKPNLCYSCNIMVNKELYNLLSNKHKSRLNLDIVKDEVWRLIESIKYIGKKECQCILVDNKEHLYLTNDFIVTHNTVACLLSFMLYTMTNFEQQNFAIAGKSVGAVRRNLIIPLKSMLISLGYDCIEHRSENYLEITYKDNTNYYYLFGLKDETAADHIQGFTLASAFIDEVAVANENGFNQLLARLSIEGAKVWTSSNPESPYHWFYLNFIKKAKEKDLLYLHFTMDDNPSLSDEIKNRYKKMYSGVWKKRFIDGRWCAAEGLIYDMFSDEYNIVDEDDIPYDRAKRWCIGVDYGTGNATVFLLGFVDDEDNIYICREYYFAGRQEAQESGNFESQKTDLEFTEDMREFILSNYDITGLTYRDIDIMVDPAATSFILQMRRFHMKSKRAMNEVLDGIRNVATYIAERKLKVSSECVHLIEELHTYSWDEKAQARGQDVPLKVNDHCVDALRYTIMKLKPKSKITDATRNLGL